MLFPRSVLTVVAQSACENYSMTASYLSLKGSLIATDGGRRFPSFPSRTTIFLEPPRIPQHGRSAAQIHNGDWWTKLFCR